MKDAPRLSPLVRGLLRLLLTEPDYRTLRSELGETYRIRMERAGEDAARAWFRREGRRAVFHAARSRLSGTWGAVGPPVVLADLRRAVRRLLRAPTFTLSVVVTVALGIGGTTAVFALVHGVLLKPLPYPEADELVHIFTELPQESWGFSMADADALIGQQTTFESVAFLSWGTATLDTGDGTDQIRFRLATPSFFTLSGIDPALGREITEADVAPDAEAVAVVSWAFWQNRLGGDREAVGTSIRMNGSPVTVVGVLPPGVDPLTDGFDLVVPLRIRTPSRKGPFTLLALGRVKAGSRVAAAEELRAIEDRIFAQWEASWPRPEATWAMRDLEEQVIGDAGKALWVSLGAVGFLLLIACANVANLLVARGLAQRRELAVRTALGASRSGLLRHALAESGVLTLIGAALALGLASLGVGVATRYGADFIPRIHEVGLTPPVLIFFGGITAGAVLLFGLLPAIQSTKSHASVELRAGGRGSSADAASLRVRRVLVAGQFAVTAPLLVGAGLLLGSLDELQHVDPGFDARHMVTAQLILPPGRYTRSDTSALRMAWERLTERTRQLPGVEAAGLGTGRPPDRPAFGNNFVLEDRPLAPGEAQPTTPWVIAEPGYFRALDLEVVAGRMFDGERDPPRVLLVDESWARRFLPGQEVVGRRLRHGGCTRPDCPPWTIIGVVEDVRYSGLDDPGAGTVYMNFQRWTGLTAMILIRTTDDEPGALMPSLRRTIRETEPGTAIAGASTGQDLLADALREPRYLGVLVASFAALALALALVGAYGTMAYFVHQQRKGIGIRLALGDRTLSVAALVLGGGIKLAAIGTGLGLLLGLGLSGYLEGVLFRVQPTDPWTFAMVTATLIGAAGVASWGPALRAARTDPARILREE